MSPRLTVVIPTFANAHMLKLTLDSLAGQTLPMSAFEVVVVRDGGPADSYEDLERTGTGLMMWVHHLTQRRGRSAARNVGIDAAKGNTILFLDSDSYADSRLLERHLSFHESAQGPRVLMGKRYELGVDQLGHVLRGESIPAEALDRIGVRDLRFRDVPTPAGDWLQTPWLFAYGHNISAPTATLRAVGGYDERFGLRWGCEDMELFYRVFLHHDRKATIFDYDDRAACYHLPHHRDHAGAFEDFMVNYRAVTEHHPHMDWEFMGPWPTTEMAARIRQYRKVLDDCHRQGSGEVGEAYERVAGRLAARHAERVLWIGAGTAALPLGAGAVTYDHGRAPSATNHHLLVTAPPPGLSELDAVVNVDLWRHLAWDDLLVFVRDALGCAPELSLVAVRPALGAAELDYLVRTFDHAYSVDVDGDETGATLLHFRRNGTA